MTGAAWSAKPVRPALTAPPLDAEAAERIRALLGLAVRRCPDLPVGIHPKPVTTRAE